MLWLFVILFYCLTLTECTSTSAYYLPCGFPIFWLLRSQWLLHPRSGLGFPGSASGKGPACQCRRLKKHGFDPWVGEIPWRRAWQPTPVFLPGESHEHRSWWATVHRVTKNWTQLKQLITRSCLEYGFFFHFIFLDFNLKLNIPKNRYIIHFDHIKFSSDIISAC